MRGLVLPALVGVKDEFLLGMTGKRPIQHRIHQCFIGTVSDGVSNDFSVVHVEHGREIKFLLEKDKLRDIGRPLGIWSFGTELSLNQVGSLRSDGSLVGSVLFPADLAGEL